MFPDSYPASSEPIALGMLNSSFTDRDQVFWDVESQHLTCMVKEHTRPCLVHDDVKNLSIFGFVPQPLLMLLGYARGEIQSIPEYRIRTPLQRVIQLLKRHRDLKFDGERAVHGRRRSAPPRAEAPRRRPLLRR